MSTNPDEIRADIERTRANLSYDVDALADQAKPRNIAKRQVSKVKEAGVDLKDRIMGSASEAADSASSSLNSAASSVQGAAASVGDTVTNAPQAARQKTQGNPLAAGLIAFGAGLLISSLFPASQKERQAASSVKENIEPLKQQASDVAKEMADNLRAPAQHAVESVKATATEAAATVKDEGSSAATEVKDTAQEATQTVREEGTAAAAEVQETAREAKQNVEETSAR